MVGAGVIGCAVAHELASRGAGVHVIDRREAGQGATRASAGILAPRIEGHREALLTLGLSSLALYDDFVRCVSADAGRPVEYRRTGTLQVARTEDEAAALREAAGALAAAGAAHALVGADEARAMEPALGSAVVAGLVVPEHGYVGVASLVAALHAAGTRRGVTWSHETVERIEPDGRGVRVTTAGPRPGVRVDADAVVDCAGSWSGQLGMRASPPPVRPIRGQLVHLRFARAPLSHVIWGEACYLVPWSDGSLLVGATTEDVGFDESATEEGARRLMEAARELLPCVDEATVAGVRVGLRPATADELPLIGASPTMPGVYHATGHYRSGVLLAPLTARLLADLIVDERRGAALDLVRPERFLQR